MHCTRSILALSYGHCHGNCPLHPVVYYTDNTLLTALLKIAGSNDGVKCRDKRFTYDVY